ncbi:MAG: hypothetical protein GY804_01165 [Alphaproteobacteria bacterium]|nr:hypothetical protein [Alphaproteobacteria bacterium]
MRIIFIILLLCQVTLGQFVNETFSNFYPTITDSLKMSFRFDTLNFVDTLNYADATIPITRINDDDLMVGDSMLAENVMYSGGQSVYFNLTGSDTTAYEMSAANITAISPGSDDFRFDFIAKVEVSAAKQNLYESIAGDGLRLSIEDDGSVQLLIDDGPSGTTYNSGGSYQDTTWHVYTVDLEGDSLRIYVDYAQIDTTIDFTGRASIDLSDELVIGRRETYALWGLQGHASGLSYWRGVVPAVVPIAYGWYSKNDNITRDSWAFAQGFFDSDTLYFPVSDSTIIGGKWSLSINAKGTKSGDVLTAWLGSGTPITQTLTASTTTYTLDLGAVDTSGDSLWFSASASDTVYIDNVEVSFIKDDGRFKRFNRFSRFKRF